MNDYFTLKVKQFWYYYYFILQHIFIDKFLSIFIQTLNRYAQDQNVN